MRKIKFRAWNKVNKKMLDVFQVSWNKNGEISRVLVCEPKVNILEKGFYDIHDEELKYLKLMQYTELKDKNKKEIYEGDIVRVEIRAMDGFWEVLGDVVYENGCFKIRLNSHIYRYVPLCEVSSVEVIGNVYEDLELIK